MASLKYSSEQSEITSVADAREAVSVTIALSSLDWRAFSEALGEISNREGSELRTDFPAGWTIFWKVRDGDSRFFVAHPEPNHWVATLAVSADHLVAIRRLMEGGAGGSLSRLGPVSRMSNLEVNIGVRESSS